MSRGSGSAAVVFIALMTLGSLAAAAPKAKKPPVSQEAAARIKRGTELFDSGEFKAALLQFRAAQRAAPSWEVLYDIGRCERRLDKFGDAVKDLQAYLSQGGAQVPADRRDAVAKELAEIQAQTAVVTITVPGAPAGVSIDGDPVGTSPFADPFLLAPGKKVFWAKREGERPAEKTEDLRPGTKVTVVLSPSPKVAEPEVLAPEPAPEGVVATVDGKRRFPLVGVAVGGAGLAAIGVAIGLNVSAQSRAREVNGLFASGGRWDGYYDAVQARGEREQAWSIAAGLGGAAALATGTILTLVSLASEPSEGENETAPAEEKEKEEGAAPVEETRLFVAPVSGGGLYCGVSFRW